jgi:nucleolar GTP-binding protein
MNFQNMPPVPTAQHLIDLAFGKGRKREKKKRGEFLLKHKKHESAKLDKVKDALVPRLAKVLGSFPATPDLSFFYQRLMKLTLDFSKYQKSLGSLNWSIKKVRAVHRSSVSQIIKGHNVDSIFKTSQGFYGRVASILKQIDKNLSYLDSARRTMRTYPDVKEMFTVCIYGFPNVGKTTLLNKLAGSKAKVASYAFTTLTINSGFMTLKGEPVQLLDVPGTLARKEKMNNVELQAELAVYELADLVIYVFDVSEFCGFSLKDQERLYQRVKKQSKVIVYVSKQDILDKSKLKDFQHEHFSVAGLKKEIRKVMEELPVMEDISAREED